MLNFGGVVDLVMSNRMMIHGLSKVFVHFSLTPENERLLNLKITQLKGKVI